MIQADFYQNSNHIFTGFRISGHAGYAKYNQDIVCAAVSALATGIVNSAEVHATCPHTLEHSDSGYMEFRFTEEPDEIGQVLIHTLEMALVGIRDSYGEKFIQVHYKEV